MSDPAIHLNDGEEVLFRDAIWFRYEPEAALLHLEGGDGRLASFTGMPATEVWERLLCWRNRYGVAPLPPGMISE